MVTFSIFKILINFLVDNLALCLSTEYNTLQIILVPDTSKFYIGINLLSILIMLSKIKSLKIHNSASRLHIVSEKVLNYTKKLTHPNFECLPDHPSLCKPYDLDVEFFSKYFKNLLCYNFLK